jgi:hypothetical protein
MDSLRQRSETRFPSEWPEAGFGHQLHHRGVTPVARTLQCAQCGIGVSNADVREGEELTLM